ncbi:WhiB family transcriptional regulator [Intrasporangium calvum]|uniref:Transcriptional regulator WhiB n=1 Tax=Intrasporangium calvum (strain ATCC 23552 / DSM 43043 / JCM 3097 / NBRC 12989 / NCIMB 10167 / NRRL B-3866 / 7 KIP) TaxID=710696 RepID=E6SDX5_INTC7|nr:WhiB family transcriptional regulator [Intrasporangium calvum]ADU46578.1 transcription factor WhiB [Intrasporangium calvum DSM 43043]
MRGQVNAGVFLHRYGRADDTINHGDGPSPDELLRAKWMRAGSCRGDEKYRWFGQPNTLKSLRAAAICRECPVRQMCLASALVFGEEFGVWGGLNPVERRPLHRRLALGETLGSVLRSVLNGERRAA